ncbi:AAA family ATPase [Brachyspira sp. G79]|uniref:AAA family ATPase n=1 Tax=Brachyspira sp. G79 TaxID=1358104 RepID=UPI000BBCBB4E|nr:AAA family ATPase [Brachyspira sp. G79]
MIFLEKTSENKNIETYDNIINNISNDAEKTLKNSYRKIMQEVSKRYFNEIFKNQINNLYHRESTASLELEIKNKKMNIDFKNNECIKFEEEFDIINNIYYMDNPFILDKINGTENKYSLIDKKLIASLTKDYTENMYENIFSAVKNNDIMKNLEKLLKNITIGEIIKNNGVYYLKEDNIDIVFENLSAGLKSFIIIKMLLSNTSLKENDILILDEPEIHLHPKWQLIYAELIVLLNKYLNLIVIITSHSPYFVDAINRYAKLHEINNNTNFYLSELEKDNKNTIISNVNENIDLIYKKMYEPIEILNNMKYDEDIE